MAHIDKATRLQVHGLIRHDQRLSENHTNEKIDPSRSHLNYNLASGDPWQHYSSRMQEVYCLNRRDVNTMAMITVTLPKDVRPEDQEPFFRSCYSWFAAAFGEENVISAFVHLDETTPHIHMKAIPVVADPKKGEKISFKEKCPRSFYQNYHKDLSAWIQRDLGYQVSILNGATLEGNKTIKQLKEETLKEQIREIDRKTKEISQAKIEPAEPVKILGKGEMVSYDSYREAVDQVSVLQKKNKALEIENREQRNKIQILTDQLIEWSKTKVADLKEQIKDLKDQVWKLFNENKQLKEDLRDHEFYKGFYDQTVQQAARSEDKEWIEDNVIPEEYQKQFSEDVRIEEKELARSYSKSRGMSL